MISNPSARRSAQEVFFFVGYALLLLIIGMGFAARSGWAQDAKLAPSPVPTPQPFTARAASPLLLQIRDGLQTRDVRRMLAAFDLSAMPDAALFQQQLLSFFSHTETIRVHLNLVNATGDQEKGTAEVDAELEADLGDNTVPVHKQARLKFSAALNARTWRFVDVQPRPFFSTQP
ncbi:MAG TPA: hypothetical protein VE783_10190 [Candidatus Limnocylindrales bacterium]|nr:hypothetical protein [Candidatus Limnocylindrales bacterium]